MTVPGDGSPSDQQSYPVDPPQGWPPAGQPPYAGTQPYPDDSPSPAASWPSAAAVDYPGPDPIADQPGFAQPVLAAPVQPPGGVRALWNHPMVIAGVMGTILLLVTALGMVAIKAVQGPSEAGSGREPAATTGAPNAARPDRTDAVPDASGPNHSGPKETGAAPAPSGSPPPFLTGKLSLGTLPDVDLETAKQIPARLEAAEQFDLRLTKTTLEARNGAQVLLASSATDLCSDPAAPWVASLHVSVLKAGQSACVRTNEGRLGRLDLDVVDLDTSGQLFRIDFRYIVWKKAGDQ